MAVSLKKNESVSLSKAVEELANLTIGLGWDVAKRGHNIDCDSSVIVLTGNNKPKSKGLLGGLFKKAEEDTGVGTLQRTSDVVYFGNRRHSSGCIYHNGDNLTGAGDGDDEQINVNLNDMPADVKRLVVVVNIYACRSRGQHFGMIDNCYARIVDNGTRKEICRYNLSEDYSGKTAMILGELYRENNEWHFKAIGEGTTDTDIKSLASRYE